MEPQIRYVRSADGIMLAVATLGRGPVLVVARGIANFGSIEGEFADPRRVELYQRLSESRTVVTFDPRGVGLSQREVDDISLEANTADLAAVIESLEAKQVALRAHGASCGPAIRYAAEHPERVLRLVLGNYAGFGRGRQLSDGRRAIGPIFDYDFDLWVQVLLLMDAGWKNGALIYEALGSRAISKEMLTRQWRETRNWDVRDLLPRISCPTLVIHTASPDCVVPIDAMKEIAASIPNARFRAHAWDLETQNIRDYEATRDFLDEEKDAPDAASHQGSGMAVILFADIADSTALTEQLGDVAFRERARALDAALRIAVRDNGGVAIDGKLLGDGLLATFPAASQAFASALACEAAGSHAGLPLHVGVHAGDVIREPDNVYGGAVNIAARISALAEPGDVLVSDIVRGLARTSAGVAFEDRGEHALKGIADAQRVFAVRRTD